MEVEPSRWDATLARLGLTDVYASRGFVAASAPLAGGEPVLLHLEGEGGDVVFPCLVRRDPVDVVSPYGYGGPLGAGAAPPWAEFAAAYEGWCAERGVVSTFVVFHPLAGNAERARGFHTAPLGGTVAWRLDAPDLLAGMHRHHRRLVRRALTDGCEASVLPAPADLDGFVAAYEATMRRNDASAYYFFAPAYWDALRRDVPLVLVEVRREGDLLAAVLGMGRPPWLHYHLGASTDAGRGTGASHLALLTLARWGQEQGYDVLHLGGGVRGGGNALLEYKLRFAPDGLIGSAIGKAVHDERAYLELAGADAVDWDGFFPAYREPR